MTPDGSPEKAATRRMIEQATTFNTCIEIATHADKSEKEPALQKALEFAKYYDEAIYVNMASGDKKLQEKAIRKAITLTEDHAHLEFWTIKALSEELKILAKEKLKTLKKEVKK
jgi:hypothetical protein